MELIIIFKLCLYYLFITYFLVGRNETLQNDFGQGKGRVDVFYLHSKNELEQTGPEEWN